MGGFAVKFSSEKLESNYQKLRNLVLELFPDRQDALTKLYDDAYEIMVLAPASSVEHYHNTFTGGYIDHILRVYKYAQHVYELYKQQKIDVSGFTENELLFVAIHHDLGKLGFVELGESGSKYIPCESDWHRLNMGKLYDTNPNIPFSLVQHGSLYTLQRYNVSLSWNEFQGILIHDGLYDETNKAYLLTPNVKSKLKTKLPIIVHQADLMASMFEYDRWYERIGSKQL